MASPAGTDPCDGERCKLHACLYWHYRGCLGWASFTAYVFTESCPYPARVGYSCGNCLGAKHADVDDTTADPLFV